jgi:hypothetical protein
MMGVKILKASFYIWKSAQISLVQVYDPNVNDLIRPIILREYTWKFFR